MYNQFMGILTNVPTIPNRTRIPAETIQALVNEIVDRFHPHRVILFGSYARKNPRPDSDVDLLVVLPTQLSETEQAAKICREIPYRFGLDLLVCTPKNLAQRLEWGDSFLKEIISTGVTLYESSHD
ncbi:MAG: nucleotidyltransferase domain-containing protein [Anaerolineaceae bacterium]